MLIDIVILPPVNTRKKIGSRLEKEIGKFPNVFVVDNKKLIPHLSLWHMKVCKRDLDKISDKLKEVIKDQKPIKITSSGFRVSKNYKECMEFGVKENKTLISLQKKVLNNIYEYKSGMMPSFGPFANTLKGEKLKQAKKYGRSLGFHPQLTAGWLKEEKDSGEIVGKMKKFNFEFIAKEVYVCEIDKWWQVKNLIKKINFK